MKIAIPVKDDSLAFFSNAGHTPKFAIYDMNGTGMFVSFKLDTIKNNPRTDIDHNDENHTCAHDGDDAEHIAQHNKMGAVLDECDYIVLGRACKNTAKSMGAHDVKIVKYSGDSTQAEVILKEVSAKFKR
ncbi:MAG: putative Fe-Mo cluster-binding NifX family protein [Sulfurimonas sp.]|jgi:predicted Fe-Mo cluster-binding NifX family protein